MNKLAYENQSLIDFRKENTAKINKLFATILWYSNIVGVFLIIFSLIGFFDTSIKFCIIVELLSLSFSLIQSLTTKYVKNQRYLMFQGIILISSLIGFLSINNTVGIYISYGLVSFISCLYLEEKVTVLPFLTVISVWQFRCSLEE